MLPSRGILSPVSPSNNNTTTNNNSLQQQINIGNFSTTCYNNARTPFAIHEILGLASAATQMPNMTGANLFAASSSANFSCSRFNSFENNAAAAAAYFIPPSYYQANFLESNLNASMTLPQSSCQSQIFPQLDMNSASFITANMSNLDYTNTANLDSKNFKNSLIFHNL